MQQAASSDGEGSALATLPAGQVAFDKDGEGTISTKELGYKMEEKDFDKAVCGMESEDIKVPEPPILQPEVLLPKSAVKVDVIRLTVQDHQLGSEMPYTIKQSTPLKNMMDAYRSRLQTSQDRLIVLAVFTVDGKCILPDGTAAKLGLEDGGLIDVAVEYGREYSLVYLPSAGTGR